MTGEAFPDFDEITPGMDLSAVGSAAMPPPSAANPPAFPDFDEIAPDMDLSTMGEPDIQGVLAPSHRAATDPTGPDFNATLYPQHETRTYRDSGGLFDDTARDVAAGLLNVPQMVASAARTFKSQADIEEELKAEREGRDPGFTARLINRIDAASQPGGKLEPSLEQQFSSGSRIASNVIRQGVPVAATALAGAALPLPAAGAGLAARAGTAAIRALPGSVGYGLQQHSGKFKHNVDIGLEHPRAEAVISGGIETLFEEASGLLTFGAFSRALTPGGVSWLKRFRAAAPEARAAMAKSAGSFESWLTRNTARGKAALAMDMVKTAVGEAVSENLTAEGQHQSARAFGDSSDQAPNHGDIFLTSLIIGAGLSGVTAHHGIKQQRQAREALTDQKAPKSARLAATEMVANELEVAGLKSEAAILRADWGNRIDRGLPIALDQQAADETDPRAQVSSPADLAQKTADYTDRAAAARSQVPAAPAGSAPRSKSPGDLLAFLQGQLEQTGVAPKKIVLTPPANLTKEQQQVQDDYKERGFDTIFFDTTDGSPAAAVSGGPTTIYLPSKIKRAEQLFKAAHEAGHGLDERVNLKAQTGETRQAIAEAIPEHEYAGRSFQLEIDRAAAGLDSASAAVEFDELVQDIRGEVGQVTALNPKMGESKVQRWAGLVAEADPTRWERMKERMVRIAAGWGVPGAQVADPRRGTVDQWGRVGAAILAENRAATGQARRVMRSRLVNALGQVSTAVAGSGPDNKIKDVLRPSAGFSRRAAAKAEAFARPGEFNVGEIVRHTSDGGEYRILEPAGPGYYRIQRGKEMPVTAPVAVLARVPAKQKGQIVTQDAPARGEARQVLEDRARVVGVADLSGSEQQLADRIASRLRANATLNAEENLTNPVPGQPPARRNPLIRRDRAGNVTPVIPPRPLSERPAPPAQRVTAAEPTPAPAPREEAIAQPAAPEPAWDRGNEAPAAKASIPAAAETGPARRSPLLPSRRVAEEIAAEFPAGDYLAKSEASMKRGGVVYQIVDRRQIDQKLPRGGVVVRALNGPKADQVLHLTLEQARELERFDERDLGAMEERAAAAELRKSGEVKSLIGEIKRQGGIRIGQDVRRDLRPGALKDLQPPPGVFVHSITASSLDEMTALLGYQEIDDLVEDLRLELETGKPAYYEGVKSSRYSLPGRRKPLVPSRDGESAGKFSVPSPYNPKYPIVSTLTGNEIGKDITVENAVELAHKYFQNNLQGRPIDREGLRPVRVTGEGWKKLRFGLPHDEVRVRIIPAIPDIIKHGIYHGRELVSKKRGDDIVAFHYFTGAVALGKNEVRAGVSVGEDRFGNLFYNINRDPERFVEKRRAPLLPEASAQGAEPTEGDSASDLNLNIASKDGNVNPGAGPAPAGSQAGPVKASLAGPAGSRQRSAALESDTPDPEVTDRIRRAFGKRGLSVYRFVENAVKYWPAGGKPPEDILSGIPEGAEILQRVERTWAESHRRAATWLRPLTVAHQRLNRTDRKYVTRHFVRAYEEGGVGQAWPSEAIQSFAEAWRDVNDTVATEAGQLIESFSGRDPDTYVPHRLTDEGRTALEKKSGPEWDALREAAEVAGIDIHVLEGIRQDPLRQSKYGSIDYARIAELPWEVSLADGTVVPILETDPTLLFGHVRSAARRLSTVEEFGTDEKTSKDLDEVAAGLISRGGMKFDEAKDALTRIWHRLEGQDARADQQLDEMTHGVWKVVDSIVASLSLSGAVIGNVVGGHLPQSVRMGFGDTARAFAEAYTTSLKNPELAELHALVDLEGDLLQELADTETLSGRAAKGAGRLLRATGFVAANRRINFAVAVAMQKRNLELMLDAIRQNKDSVWQRRWGKDAGAARRYLQNELKFSEADVERMVLEGPSDKDMSRAIGKQLELVNAMNESPGSRPRWVAHPLWRMAFAYSTFVRKMYDTTKYSVNEAKAGNVRPLATLIVAGAPTAAAMAAIKDWLKDREDEDKGFWDGLVNFLTETGAIGLAGSFRYAILRMNDPRADFFTDTFKPPHLEVGAKVIGGGIRALRDQDIKPLWKGLASAGSGLDIIDKQATKRGLLPSRRTVTDEGSGVTVTATRRQREYADRLVGQVYVRTTTRNGVVRNPLDPVPSKFRPVTTRRLVADLRADGLDDEQILTLIEDARARRAREK